MKKILSSVGKSFLRKKHFMEWENPLDIMYCRFADMLLKLLSVVYNSLFCPVSEEGENGEHMQGLYIGMKSELQM